MAAVTDPKTGLSWDAETAEDAYFIRMGRRDLAPGTRLYVPPPQPPPQLRTPSGTYCPADGYYYEVDNAEDAYYLGLGRPDLALSKRYVGRK